MSSSEPSEEELHREIQRLRKVNQVLMDRVERGMDLTGGAYSLFQAATVLEQKVHERTAALESAKRFVEDSNEKLVAAKEAAEAALKTKDEFLASMSHELRTPLNAILGASESLIDGIHGPVTEAQTWSLRIVESSGRHLLALINDVLDMARIGAGELQLQLEPLVVGPVVQASLNIVSGTAHKRGISLTFTDAETRMAVVADERRLKQILVNLLGNAIKFTDRGGSVRVEVTTDPDRPWARIAVSDTGVGIAKENLSRLFRPFVQVDSSLGRRFEGTGLGLSLVANMVDLHGGEVSVESEPGIGSTFTVSFPLVESEETGARLLDTTRSREPDSEAGFRLPGHRGQRILLVEDNQANIDVIAPYLEAKGYHMTIAMRGEDAIAMAQSHAPNLILMDIQMPGIDGLEAIERIRASEEGVPVPIIALTALAMPGDRERCIAAGANEHVTKPVRLRSLHEVIGRLLDRATDAGRVPAVVS